MTTEEILNKALSSNIILIDEKELIWLLKEVEIIREEQTHLSDYIRIFRRNNHIFIQETTFKKEIIIRKMDSMKEADFFVQDRLDYYERKWDGCGCKINYYE